ncbi:MAG: MarR family transcriptional regulator [Cellulomonas sp.]|nr:MarR family transcriptional regulator [Cellulomonas sp.]
MQWDALRHLAAHPGASLHDIAVRTFQTDQAFGTLATRMEARGLIRRTTGPGRAIRPELTAEGERVLAAGTDAMDRILRGSFERLSPSERAAFGDMLARLVDDAPGAGASSSDDRSRSEDRPGVGQVGLEPTTDGL